MAFPATQKSQKWVNILKNVLFSLCKGTIRDSELSEMIKVRLLRQATMILFLPAGRAQKDKGAPDMKIKKIRPSPARWGKRSPELAHKHFGHPEGGISKLFQGDNTMLL